MNSISPETLAAAGTVEASALPSAQLALGTDDPIACQLTSTDNPSSGPDKQNPIQDTAEIKKQNTAAAVDPRSSPSPSASTESPCSAFQFASVVASAEGQQPSHVTTLGNAALASVSLPNPVPPVRSNTLQAEGRQESSQHHLGAGSSQLSEDAAATTLGALAPADEGNVAISAAAQAANSSAVEAAQHNQNATPKRSPEALNRSERKADTGGGKPAQSAISTQLDEPGPPQPAVGDAFSWKAQPLQPTFAALMHGNQDKPAAPTSAVLPEMVQAELSDPAARTARAQTGSEAVASAPAETAQAAPGVIQSARVLERMGQSEMRLGLNSSYFGSIELHTSVNQDRVGASIATGHSELRAAMLAEIPLLERAIAQHHLTLDNLNMDSGPGRQAGNSGAFSENPSASQSWPRSVAKISEDTAPQEASLPQTWTSPYSSGLNVHA